LRLKPLKALVRNYRRTGEKFENRLLGPTISFQALAKLPGHRGLPKGLKRVNPPAPQKRSTAVAASFRNVAIFSFQYSAPRHFVNVLFNFTPIPLPGLNNQRPIAKTVVGLPLNSCRCKSFFPLSDANASRNVIPLHKTWRCG
jgi:hypothetical protein